MSCLNITQNVEPDEKPLVTPTLGRRERKENTSVLRVIVTSFKSHDPSFPSKERKKLRVIETSVSVNHRKRVILSPQNVSLFFRRPFGTNDVP